MTILYFAYGSNLLDREIRKDALDAEAIGSAYLPGHRLVFTKHSTSRGCDAANIEPYDSGIVWGCLYRVTERDREALRRRERGYREVKVGARARTPEGGSDKTVEAFTFVGEETCPRMCGPNAAYLGLIIEGARSRGLPESYIEKIEGEGFS